MVEFDADMAPTHQMQTITGLPSLGLEGTGNNAIGPSAVAFNAAALYVLTGLGADPAARDTGGPLETVGANFAQLHATGPGDAFTPWVDIGDYEAAENPAADPLALTQPETAPGETSVALESLADAAAPAVIGAAAPVDEAASVGEEAATDNSLSLGLVAIAGAFILLLIAAVVFARRVQGS